MWDLYASRNAGLSIQTTVDSLSNAIQSPLELRMVEVQYIDYESFRPGNELMFGGVSSHTSVAYKRRSFVHEQEVRIVFFDRVAGREGVPSDELPNVQIDIDLGLLIERLYIAPSAPKWHLETIRSAFVSFGLEPTLVTQSGLYDVRVV